ncbi:MAG: peptidoglycan-binding protein [Duganella sp.]
MAGLNLGLKQKMMICPVVGEAPRTPDTGNGIEVLINPSGYQRTMSVCYNKRPTLGQPAATPAFSHIQPEVLTLPQLVLDGTGVVALVGLESVTDMLNKLLALLYNVDGDKHEPNLVCFQWGDLTFYGRVTEIAVDYTLFKPTGEPLRAKIKLTVISDMTVKEGLLRANLSSPDLTHLVEVRAGDTLPLLCQRIYRDPAYYLAVAEFNGLVDFRNLAPGAQLRFPPLS